MMAGKRCITMLLAMVAAATSGVARIRAAPAGGWSKELRLDDKGKTDNGDFYPPLACDSDGDCIVLIMDKKFPLIEYKLRRRDESWASEGTRALSASGRQEQAQVAVYGGNKGFVLAYRDKSSSSDEYSIQVAYITKSDAIAGRGWVGSGRNNGFEISTRDGDKNTNRLPTIAADKDSNVVVVWQTTASDELQDGSNIGPDKDLVSISFQIVDGEVIRDVTRTTSLFSGVETDNYQDRNPVALLSPYDQRIAVGATATVTNGFSDIMFTETTGDVCAWSDRVPLTNFDGKDSDVSIAASYHKSAWLAAWAHRGTGIRYARISPDSKGSLTVDKLGFVDPIAFPRKQNGEPVVLVADPMQADHWAIFYLYKTDEQTDDGTALRRLVFRVSKDDGDTWSSAYYADDEGSEYYNRFLPVATRQGEYMLVMNRDKSKTFINTTRDQVYSTDSFKASQKVPSIDVQEATTSFPCFTVELPRNGSRLDFSDHIYGMVPSITRCIRIVAPASSRIHMNLEVLLDLETFPEYFSSCPFTYVGIREQPVLRSGDFGLAEKGSYPRRMCEAKAYPDVHVDTGSLYVMMKTDIRGLPGKNKSAVPFALEAWTTPSMTSGADGAAGGPKAFERRTAASFKELQAHLRDTSFAHGEVRVTARTLTVTEELVIRQGTNISIVANEGSTVDVNGRDVMFVEQGAILWRLRGFVINRDESGLEPESKDVARYGGLISVHGSVGRIERCTFEDSTAYGNLEQRVGGALLIDGHVDTIVDTVFRSMHAAYGAAVAITVQGQVDIIDNCEFTDNEQNGLEAGIGGAILVEGRIGTISKSTFENNICNGVGGAIGVEYGGVLERIIDTDFIGNNGGLFGGAVHFAANSRLPSLWQGGSVRGNLANAGAAIYVTGALPPLKTIESCAARSVCFRDVSFSDNIGISGGAVQLDESPDVDIFDFSSVSFAGNAASAGLGGAFLGSGAVNVNFAGATFTSNRAGTAGGALALASDAKATLTDSRFARNDAAQQGGAIYAGNGASVAVTDTSFVDNQARFTCREQTVCKLEKADSRLPCGAVANGYFAKLNELGQAPHVLGCTKGVGGSVYIAAGVNAHIHQSKFSASNPLPSVPADETYISSSGEEKAFVDEAGRYVYAESRFRLSETTFDGAATSFAPSRAVIGCPGTCSSTGTCFTPDDPAPSDGDWPKRQWPSVRCTCAGAYEGSNGYDEGGCSQLRVGGVRAESVDYKDGSLDADGSAAISWTWSRGEVDFFVVYRTANRSSSSASADWSSCISADRAASEVAYCAKVTDSSARSISMGLRAGEPSFFRVVAHVGGLDTGPSDPMSSASIVCEAGAEATPTKEDGMFECAPCARGTYVEDSAEGCKPCPHELQTTFGVATSVADCVAPAGYYLVQENDGGVEIFPCEAGLDCAAAGQSLESLFLEPGHWRPSLRAKTVFKCPIPAACVGGNGTTSSAPERRRELSLWTEPLYCSGGHTGPYCSVCESGFSKDADGLCSSCTDEKLAGEYAIIGVVAGLVLFVWPAIIGIFFYFALRGAPGDANGARASRSSCGWARRCCNSGAERSLSAMQRYRGPLNLMIGLVQVVSGFQRVFGSTYPWWSQWDLYTSFTWANVDASSLPAVTGCVIEDRQENRLFLATGLPFVLLLIIALCFVLARCCAAPESRDRLASTSWYLVAFLMFLVFPAVNTTIVQTLVCDVFEDGTSYLRFDYATDCSEMGWLTGLAILMGVIYVVGPVVLFVTLISKSDEPATRGAAFLHQLYVPKTRVDGSRWYHVRRYYEVYELLRKYLLTSAVLLVADGTVGQVAFALLICFLSTLAQTIIRPYVEEQDNILATVVQTQLFLILCALLISPIVEDISALEGMTVVVLLAGPVLAIGFVYLRLRRGRSASSSRADGGKGESRSSASSLHSSSGDLETEDHGGAGFSYTVRGASGAQQEQYYKETRRGSSENVFDSEARHATVPVALASVHVAGPHATSFEATPVPSTFAIAVDSDASEAAAPPPPPLPPRSHMQDSLATL